MKIAILGGGLAGLSAANVLEKYGVIPTVFETKQSLTDYSPRAQTLISVFVRPIQDSISHLSEEHGLYINPKTNITELVFHSKRETAVVRGHLGYITIRGDHPSSLESQLGYNLLDTEIVNNSSFTMADLEHEFDKVIIATGDPNQVDQIKIPGNYKEIYYKDALISGEFNKNRIHIFQNHNIAPKSFGYLVPLNDSLANLKISFPIGYLNKYLAKGTISTGWQYFLQLLYNKFPGISLVEVKEFSRIVNYASTGAKGRIGNYLLTGNCLGSVMPMLGYDQFFAISSGVHAAKSVINQKNYDSLISPLMRQLTKLQTIYQGMSALDNRDFDNMVKTLNTRAGGIFFNSKYDILKVLEGLLYPMIK
ncbi:FAD-dependent monooxygenase [Natranaerobius thermophilus]|uniref:FAD dependent dehydrogenase n=1 Tax=Natranaerobius thermophilus (strain ATCC BAA-1301 / DSM 18059 / JW/NM-WN-LF) TaxID=457570 RepID=B2A787_NATTJ|nr:FAD-dependent monooxygenase [Natranaerobius thermophilus]ACB84281.1 FAD dependent dehydrogenase [Natranaerobius thermophilus JW/NM-WN-LF]